MPERNFENLRVRQWAQEQIDMCIQQMEMEQGSDISQEHFWHTIEQDQNITLKPSMIVAEDAGTVDLETFRADLHRMVDDIYAEH